MKIVPPAAITDAVLLSTNVAETDYAAWNAATSYSLLDRVIRTTTHRVYERIVAGTTATAPESDPINWADVSPTNAWKMFDTSSTTATLNWSSIEVDLEPGRVSALALLEVVAASVTVEVSTPVDGVVYTATVTMIEREVAPTTWSEYFFGAFRSRANAVFDDLPIDSTATVAVTVSNPGDDAELGTLVLGLARDFGDLQFGVRAGIIDYSRKEVDAWGVATFVERSFAKRFEGRLIVPTAKVDQLHKFLAGLRATPSLWIGAAGYDALAVFGWYRDFSIEIAYPTEAFCSLTIEGIA